MTDFSPWNDIATPKSELNVRLVAAVTPVPCYWGRDSAGTCLFIIELKGDHTVQFKHEAVSIQGIELDLRAIDKNTQHLVLSLDRAVDIDLFEGLCTTLAKSLSSASDSSTALSITLVHVRRWKAFFSGNSQRLSPEQIRGLFSEITFLEEMFRREYDRNIAVMAWMGPERSHQDFIFGNTAVEIKSISGRERNTVRISSEDQLESIKEKLFLKVYHLNDLPDEGAGQTLNELIGRAMTYIKDGNTLDLFEKKLAVYGYAPLPDYDFPRFIVNKSNTYHVNGESFPRLIRSKLPLGISGVAYDIKFESLNPYECDSNDIFKGRE